MRSKTAQRILSNTPKEVIDNVRETANKRVLLQYREPSYFNSEDLYVFETGMNNLFVSSVHFYGGNWYSNEGCKYKMTSVRCINCKELYHREVKFKGLDYKGTVSKFLSPQNLGVMWNSGKQVKEYGLAQFWNNVNELEL